MKLDFDKLIFRKVSGEEIPNVSEYIINYLKTVDSGVKVMIGCDSINIRRRTMYVITVVFYNETLRKGAHYIYHKVFLKKETDVFSRLYYEATFLYDLGLYLEDKLQGHYFPKSFAFDHKGRMIKNIYGHFPNDYDNSVPCKLVEIHVDFNKHSHSARKHKTRGIIEFENKSHSVYNATMGMFCGAGFKVKAKPNAYGATNAADSICH